MYRHFIKRYIDFIISFLGILITSPVLLFITIFLAFTNNLKPFFIQPRPGKYTKTFLLFKFKTMTDQKDKYGELLPDKDRLFPLGRLIRSLSLDELPQLLNVMKGDMSIVGPRPLLLKYLPLYNSHQKRRHEVRPGITGWAQVNGRNAITWDDKFDLDVWYVDHLSFCLDIKILWMTLTKVIRKEDINSPDATTMKPFTGNK